MRILPAVVIWMLAFGGVAAAQEFRGPPWHSHARCSRTDPDAVDKDLDRLTSWAAIYRTFRLYRQCDDGYIAEGYSDAVAKLFANHWETVPEFAKLARAHPEFDQFVFWHMDETVNLVDDLAIVDNARYRCPKGLKTLCRRLVAKAKPPNEQPVQGTVKP